MGRRAITHSNTAPAACRGYHPMRPGVEYCESLSWLPAALQLLELMFSPTAGVETSCPIYDAICQVMSGIGWWNPGARFINSRTAAMQRPNLPLWITSHAHMYFKLCGSVHVLHVRCTTGSISRCCRITQQGFQTKSHKSRGLQCTQAE